MAINLMLMATGFIVTLVVGIGFMISVMSGNLKAMQFLAKHGVALFCGDINKDYGLLKFVNQDGLGWLKADNVCYLPIMTYANGKYKNHNFLQKENNYGEVYLSESQNSSNLSKISLPKKDEFMLGDLCILDGSRYGNSTNMRDANFSNIRGLAENTQDIIIVDNGFVRTFKVLGVVEQCLGEMPSLKFSTREEFIDGLLTNAIYRANYSYDKNIVILRSKSDILNLLVLLVEIN